MGFFDALRTEVAHLGIAVTTIVPGFIRTDIARNALTGTGAPTGTFRLLEAMAADVVAKRQA